MGFDVHVQPILTPEPPETTFLDRLGAQLSAAFTQENTIGAAIASHRNTRPGVVPAPVIDAVPDQYGGAPYNVVENLTPDERINLGRFVNVNSQEELYLRRTRIQEELRAKEALHDGPLPQWLAGLTAAGLDPTNYLPLASPLYRLGRGAGALGLAGEVAAQTTGQEIILRGSQATRTTQESVASVVMAGLLGAGLGAAFGRAARPIVPPAPMVEAATKDLAVSLRELDPNVALFKPDLLSSTAVGRVLEPPTIAPWRTERKATALLADTEILDVLKTERPGLFSDVDKAMAAVAKHEDRLTRYNAETEARMQAIAKGELPVEMADASVRRTVGAAIQRVSKERDAAMSAWEAAERRLLNEVAGIKAKLEDINARMTPAAADEVTAGILAHNRELDAHLDKVVSGFDSPYLRLGYLPKELPGLVRDPLSFIDGIARKHAATVETPAAGVKPGTQPPAPVSKLPPDTRDEPAKSLSSASSGFDSAKMSRLVGDTKIRPYLAALRKVALSAPGLELAASTFETSRNWIHRIVDTGMITEGQVAGMSQGRSLEGMTKLGQAVKFPAVNLFEGRFQEYRAAGGKLTRREFSDEVAHAAIRGDVSAIPEAATAAKELRQHVFDPLAKKAQEVGLLPADIDPKTAVSYFMRSYDHERIKHTRPEFEKVIADDLHGKIIKAGGKIEAKFEGKLAKLDERLNKRAADAEDPAKLAKMLEEHTAARDKLLADKKAKLDENSFEPFEVRQMASDIVDQIMGTPIGRMPSRIVPTGARGPLKERTFMIADHKIMKWIDTDVPSVIGKYVNTMAADIEFRKLFPEGQKDVDVMVKDLREEVRRAERGAKNEKEVAAIAEQGLREERLLTELINRVRGVSSVVSDPAMEPMRRVGQVMRNWNFFRLMGSSVLSQVADVGTVVMNEGLARTMGGVVRGFTSGFASIKMGVREAQLAGTATDMHKAGRITAMQDLGDPYAGRTMLERGLQAGTHYYAMATGVSPWTAALKGITANVVSDRILDGVLRVSEGKALSAREMRKFAQAGIEPADVAAIAAQREHFTFEAGAWTPNTAKWTDPQAVEAFRYALSTDVDKAVLTPGHGDAALWTGTEWGKALFQFKRFAMASNQKVLLAGLQAHDMQAMNGFLSLFALGLLSTALRDLASKGEIDQKRDIRGWVKEGFDKGGLWSVGMELDNMADKWTGGYSAQRLLTGAEASRFVGQGALERTLGPSAGLLSDVGTAMRGVLNSDFTQSDLHNLRKVAPAQNYLFLRGFLDRMEESTAQEFGLRKIDRRLP